MPDNTAYGDEKEDIPKTPVSTDESVAPLDAGPRVG